VTIIGTFCPDWQQVQEIEVYPTGPLKRIIRAGQVKKGNNKAAVAAHSPDQPAKEDKVPFPSIQ